MAISGQRAKPVPLKVVQNHRQPLPDDAEFDVRKEPLIPPKRLTESQQYLWDKYINSAWWLGTHDELKSFMWACLQDEFNENPAGMNAARITQLRMLGTELGFDPCARARMKLSESEQNKDPAEQFFT